MIHTTISFATVTKNGIVKQIGNSVGYFATNKERKACDNLTQLSYGNKDGKTV